MGRRRILAALGWLTTTVAATLVGLGAIRLIGEGITGTPGGVRDAQAVERALASPDPTTGGAAASPSGSPEPAVTPGSPATTGSPPASGSGRRSFTTPGGSAVAECGPAGVRLVFWTAAQGYRVKDHDPGPGDHVKVKFVGARGEHEIEVRCVAGRPVADTDD